MKQWYAVTDGRFWVLMAPKDGVEVTGWLERKALKGLKVYAVKGKKPGLKSLENMVMGSIAKATDGCKVEPDGTCQHGHPSWLLVLGYI